VELLTYVSKEAGLVLVLPGFNSVRFKPTINRDGAVGIARIPAKEKDRIKALETHKQYKNGNVRRELTQEEQAYQQWIKDAAVFRDKLAETFAPGELKAAIDAKKQADLFLFANNCGVSIYADENETKKSIATVKSELYQMLGIKSRGDKGDSE